ncbi:MAG TPA: glycosyltransferase family A protein [Candidatus Acidoferrales bacterium]|nr:glycosyltransferase family A protein [Candidatus Acidoferrales bacterium]
MLSASRLLGRPVRFSIVVVTYNRRELLRRCLSAATAQNYPDYEVIVVDDGSTDGSDAMIREQFPHVRCLAHRANQGEPASRNLGVEAATGDVIAFTDDDCVPPADWLRRHAAHYGDPHIGAAGGPQVYHAPSFYDRFDTMQYAVRYQRLETVARVQRFEHLLTGNLSVRREVIERVGGFDERFVTSCDADLIRRISRAGYQFVRDPDLMVDHWKTYGLGSYVRMRFHRGCGAVLTDLKDGTLSPRRFVPLFNVARTWRNWRDYQHRFGGGAATCVAFWGLAFVARWVDVAGRLYYLAVSRRRRGDARTIK